MQGFSRVFSGQEEVTAEVTEKLHKFAD